jgi:hypothetical protein
MSLAEIEQKVIALTAEERRQFAAWFYRNEDRILPADSEEDQVADEDLSPEVMAELVRRRRELDSGTVKTYSLDEVVRGMKEVVNEVRRSSH